MRVLEATSRHESFTQAAAELCTTRGAVSRHVTAPKARRVEAFEEWILGEAAVVKARYGV